MYGWLWRHLPGGTATKALLSLLLLLAVCAVLAVVAVVARGRLPFVAAIGIALVNVVALLVRA